jgi:hypothetical protein
MVLDGYINKNLNSLEFHYTILDGSENIGLISLSFERGHGDNFRTSINFVEANLYKQETFILSIVVWAVVLLYL